MIYEANRRPRLAPAGQVFYGSVDATSPPCFAQRPPFDEPTPGDLAERGG